MPRFDTKITWMKSGKGTDAVAIANVDGPGGNWRLSVQPEGGWYVRGPYPEDDRNYPEGSVPDAGDKTYAEVMVEGKRAAKAAMLSVWESVSTKPPEGLSDEEARAASGPSEYVLKMQREASEREVEAQKSRAWHDATVECSVCQGQGLDEDKAGGDWNNLDKYRCAACGGKGRVPR